MRIEKGNDQTVVKYAACKEQAERHGTSRAETSGSKSSAGKHLAEVNSAKELVSITCLLLVSRELVAAASVMLTMVLVLLLKVSSRSYAMYSVIMSLQGRLAAFCIRCISKIPWCYFTGFPTLTFN